MSPRDVAPLASTPDPDASALRRASRSAGRQIALASSALVVLVVIAAFAFVFAHLSPHRVFEFGHHESTIDVGGLDILVAAISIGAVAIALAGLLSWFATRRAIRPLGEALRVQRDFVSNASHELRTPLAVLDARLQSLQRGLRAGDAATKTVGELRRDTQTLVQIVNDLLVAAEEGGTRTVGSPVEITPVLELAVDSLGILATEKDVSIHLDAPTQVTVLAPAAAIHRCAVALLDNALRFAPSGSTIDVSLRSERNVAEVRVTDHGRGITGLDPELIFERFARGENSGAAGFGIGLSLVKDTVERFGGTVSVESTGPGGTVMLVRLPRSRRR